MASKRDGSRYEVYKGKQPGSYETWAECKEQVNGFPAACYQKQPARDAGYAVKNGREPGVYDKWQDCHSQVSGYPGASYKKYTSVEAAQDALQKK